MHELSIAMSILEIAEEQAERHGGGRVAAVHLRLGPLSGVVDDALRLAYDLARESSPLSSAELMIEEVPLTAYCPQCDAARTLASPQELCCPVCESPTPEVLTGRELDVAALEIEP
jgi:hydrogenase nickel incorporation protein HypA/HybF